MSANRFRKWHPERVVLNSTGKESLRGYVGPSVRSCPLLRARRHARLRQEQTRSPHPYYRRHGGAYIPMVMELNDPKTAIEAKCSPKCSAVMDTYKECAKRIEEKVREASRARRPQ